MKVCRVKNKRGDWVVASEKSVWFDRNSTDIREMNDSEMNFFCDGPSSYTFDEWMEYCKKRDKKPSLQLNLFKDNVSKEKPMRWVT